MDKCGSCKHWKPAWPHAVAEKEKVGGFCQSPKITEPYGKQSYEPDSLTYAYQEDGDFWTGPLFGCVHHEAKEPERLACPAGEAVVVAGVVHIIGEFPKEQAP